MRSLPVTERARPVLYDQRQTLKTTSKYQKVVVIKLRYKILMHVPKTKNFRSSTFSEGKFQPKTEKYRFLSTKLKAHFNLKLYSARKSFSLYSSSNPGVTNSYNHFKIKKKENQTSCLPVNSTRFRIKDTCYII